MQPIQQAEIEKIDLEISIDTLVKLEKDIKKYEEKVNVCDINNTNILAYNIGSDIAYLKFSGVIKTNQQEKQLKNLDNQFVGYMDMLAKCRCIKRLEK